MQTKNVRYVIALGIFVVTGIIAVQTYWFKKAFDVQEQQFSHNVQTALSNATEKSGNNCSSCSGEVEKLSASYYVVNLNGTIDTNLLGSSLSNELSQRNIQGGYEFGIYDSSSHKLMFSKTAALPVDLVQLKGKIIRNSNQSYYLGVYFPGKTDEIAGGMYIWIFSSCVLLVLIAFFSYSLFVILKQKKFFETQKDFVNNMTHEFRTPLTTIVLTADTISRHRSVENEKEVKAFSNIIREETERLNSHVERILQMSESESGQIKLNKEKVDLHELIKNTIERFPAFLQEKVSLKINLEASDPNIIADKVHLSNVLFNLLDNACKYSEGKAEINISTSIEKNELFFSVSDNGIGISKENKQKIFERFYRVPTGNLHNVKGFGLGLSYVKNIVKAHSWNLQLLSKEKAGSRFTIQIPTA